MPVKMVGGTDPPLIYGRPAYNQPVRPFVLANLDAASPLWYGPNLDLGPLSNVIYPLGSAGFDGNSDVYASTLSPGIQVPVLMLPGQTYWNPGPAIPGSTTASLIAQSPAGGGVFLAGPAQLWESELSFDAGATAAYSGLSEVNAQVITGSGVVLGVVELTLAASQNASGQSSKSLHGMTLAAGDTVQLNVNSGTMLLNALMRASAVVLYSP